MCRW